MSEQETLYDAQPKSYLEIVEDRIVEALREGVSGSVKVDNFPADILSYDFAGLETAALVHYTGSNYQSAEGATNSNQHRRMNYAIVLIARSLRGQRGAYLALEDIRLAIQGQVFEGAGPAEIVSDALISEQGGEWRWQIVTGLGAPAVARVRRTPSSLLSPVTTGAIPGRGATV